jgi:hypothetical protein
MTRAPFLLTVSLSFALASCKAVSLGGTDILPDAATDTRGDSDDAHVAMLKLLAGQPGGPGQQDGTGTDARFHGPIGVVSDHAGHLFVADSSNYTIRRIDLATAAVTTLAGSPALAGSSDGTGDVARFTEPTSVALDGAGHLFVADVRTIRQIDLATGAVTTLAGSPSASGSDDGTGTAARFSVASGLAYDGAGHLFVADGGNHTLRQVDIATGAVTTIAGSPGIAGTSDGSGSTARFRSPAGLAFDGAGKLLVTDQSNHTIRQLDLATGHVSTLAGSAGVSGTTDATGSDARFKNPRGLAMDGPGRLLIADAGNDTIRQVDLATATVTTLAGSNPVGSKDGTGADAQFRSPMDVASDGAGNLFVTDRENHSIRKIVVATRVVSTFAGATGTWGSDDGTGVDARFRSPVAVTSDGAGNLFIADAFNHTIRKVVMATGAVSTLAGSAGEIGSADGFGSTARFYFPIGVASDGAGNLYVADSTNQTIRKIVIATGVVSTIAGSAGMIGSSDGSGATARFDSPIDIASDGAGNLFVADAYNNTIRQIAIATNTVTTLAGSAGLGSGTADGTGSTARFTYPAGVASDGAGNLFVADAGNHLIRKVVIATGVVTTVAGTAGISGTADGTGTAARFTYPQRLATDGVGNLFVADKFALSSLVSNGGTIRKVLVSSGTVSTIIGSPGRYGVALGPLPAQLNSPWGLAFVSPGQLFITDASESVVLVAEF